MIKEDYYMVKVKINLRNGYYYVGELTSEDNNFISLIDKTNKPVTINKQDIVTKEIIKKD